MHTLFRSFDLAPETLPYWREEVMKSPDVIITVSEEITILEPQTPRAVKWLNAEYHAELENARDQLQVTSRQRQEVVSALKAAGFVVVGHPTL